MWTKREIEQSAISGLAIPPIAVVRRMRGKAVLTLRHAWPENVDGRVWAGVSRAMRSAGNALAIKLAKPVEIYSREGWVVDVCYPNSAW